MSNRTTILDVCKTGDVVQVDAFLRNGENYTGSGDSDFCAAVEYAIDHNFKDITEIFLPCYRYLLYRYRRSAFTEYEENMSRHSDNNTSDTEETDPPAVVDIYYNLEYNWEVRFHCFYDSDEDDLDEKSWGEADYEEECHQIKENVSVVYEVTPLMYAAKTGNTEMVKFIIPNCNGIQNRYGMTALMYAAYFGQTECVELLIPYEKQIIEKNHWTALMYAAKYGNPECVKLLIPHEADKSSYQGVAAIHLAAYFNQPKCVELLIPYEVAKNYGHDPSLHLAAKQGNLECVKLLVNYEYKMYKRYTTESALFTAAKAKQADVVRFLIPYSVGGKTSEGYSALMVAVYYNNLEIVKMLAPFEAGFQDKNSKTALMHVFDNDEFLTRPEVEDMPSDEILLEYVKILAPFEYDIRIDLKNEFVYLHHSPRRWAPVSGPLSYSQLSYSKFYYSPVTLACKKGYEFIKTLVTYGANLSDVKTLKEVIHTCLRFDISIDFLSNRIKADKLFLFYEDATPYIPIGSFLDILNKAAKQEGYSYNDSMVEIIDKLEKLSLSVLLEYSKISSLEEMESRLVNEFSEYKEKIPQVIQELKTEKKECAVCLDKSKQLYRNCINCAVNLCKECWVKCDKCPQCNSPSLIWQKSLLFECLNYVKKMC